MSGGGGGGSDDGVDYQREQEAARQARIRQGMTQIDELFNGKDVVAGYAGQLNPNATGVGDGTYYDNSGKVYSLKNGNKGNVRWAGQGTTNPAPTYKTTKYRAGHDGYLETKTKLPTPTAVTDPRRVQYNNAGTWTDLPSELYSQQVMAHQGGFDDSVFQKRAQAYTDFAMPQLNDQYADQSKALTYALARGGNLGSSLSNNKTAELDKDFALQKQAVYDTGQDYVNQGKADLATQKANAVSLLQASADPDAAMSVAQTASQQLSAMPAFTPLNSVVKNVASGLGTYLNNQSTADAIAKAQQGGGSYSLPANWKGSGRTGG